MYVQDVKQFHDKQLKLSEGDLRYFKRLQLSQSVKLIEKLNGLYTIIELRVVLGENHGSCFYRKNQKQT